MFYILWVYNKTIDMAPGVQNQINFRCRMDFDDDLPVQLNRLVNLNHFQLNCWQTTHLYNLFL